MPEADSYGEVLTNQSFRRLWLGQSLARLGSSIARLAVALYVYELTGSAQGVSLAIALQLLPWLVVAPLAGLLADRLERRRLIVAALLLQAGLVGLLPFTVNLQQVYLLVFLSSLLIPVNHVVWLAALPTITGPVLYVRGYSLDIVALNVANVIGPIVGGWLVGTVGPRPTFGAVVACLLVSTLFTLRASVPSPRLGTPEPQGLGELLRDFWAGAQFLARRPSLRYLVALNCLASFGWSATRVASIAYVTDVLGLGGREFGLLEGTVSLSIALGVYLLGQRFSRMSRQRPQMRLLVGGVLLAGLTYVALVFKPGYLPLLLLWFVNGLAWAAFWLTAQALFARLTPDPVRGRVFSLSDAAIYSAEAGLALVGGWLVAVWGSVAAFVAIGVGIGLGTVLLSAASSGYRALGTMGTALPDESG